MGCVLVNVKDVFGFVFFWLGIVLGLEVIWMVE